MNRTASRRSATSSSANSSQVFGGSSSKRNSMRGFGGFLSGSSATQSSLDLVRSTSPTPSNGTSLSDVSFSSLSVSRSGLG